MAEQDKTQVVDTAAEKKRLKSEQKKLADEQKKQKKEAKARAKELAVQQASLDEDSEGGGFSAFLVTIVIVLVWLAILGVLIKLDVGGFGSNILSPVLKDVPYLQLILPEGSVTDTTSTGNYGGYTSLEEAVNQIAKLEADLENAQAKQTESDDEIALLRAEVERLKTFEDNQVEFERIKLQFYEDVVYAENGPGADAYLAYFESMDPTTAEYLYKQVVAQTEASQEVQNYASAYSAMKPAAAAGIFEAMTDDLELAAKILAAMGEDDRGKILGAMDPTVAAKITKIMEPDS